MLLSSLQVCTISYLTILLPYEFVNPCKLSIDKFANYLYNLLTETKRPGLVYEPLDRTLAHKDNTLMSTASTLPQTAPAYRLIGRTLVIQSSTNPRLSYTVTDRGCDCMAGKHGRACKHVAKRAEVLAARQPMSDAAYAQVLEACDELC